MKNLPLLLGTIIGSLLLVVGLAFFFSSQGDPTAQQSVDPAVLNGGARHFKKGGEVVTIVEFSDFQCPACKAAQPMVESVLQKFGDKVTLVYRHYPLDTIHPNARIAAQAAEAASKTVEASMSSEVFFKYHDALFAEQETWAPITDGAKLMDYFGGIATKLALDVPKFLELIETNEVKDVVQTDVAVGNQVNVMATPTFFVNGKSVPAPQLLTTVEQLVATQ